MDRDARFSPYHSNALVFPEDFTLHNLYRRDVPGKKLLLLLRIRYIIYNIFPKICELERDHSSLLFKNHQISPGYTEP